MTLPADRQVVAPLVEADGRLSDQSLYQRGSIARARKRPRCAVVEVDPDAVLGTLPFGRGGSVASALPQLQHAPPTVLDVRKLAAELVVDRDPEVREGPGDDAVFVRAAPWCMDASSGNDARQAP